MKNRFKLSPFEALRFSDFRLFWSGSFVSQIGDQMQTVAVAWHVYQLTHSAASLGVIGLVGLLPVLIFSLLGGLSADRFDRKKLLIFSQLIMATQAGVLAWSTLFGQIDVLLIYLILFLNSTIRSFSQPARQSVMPNLVPKDYFLNAVSLNTLQRQTGTILGPAVAGLMIAVWGVGSVYLFNALSFFVLIATILPLKIPAHPKDTRASFSFSSILEGIRFVKSLPILYTTMILDFLASFFGTATILMPIFASDILGIGASGLGLLYAAPAIGGVVAGLFFSSVRNLKNQGKVILISVFIYGLATIGFGLSKFLPLSLIFLALTGAGDMTATILRNTIRQLITPDYLRGRMVSVNMVFVQGGPRLGEMEAGLLAAAVGGPVSVVIGGVGTILVTLLIAISTPKLRQYSGDKVVI